MSASTELDLEVIKELHRRLIKMGFESRSHHREFYCALCETLAVMSARYEEKMVAFVLGHLAEMCADRREELASFNVARAVLKQIAENVHCDEELQKQRKKP